MCVFAGMQKARLNRITERDGLLAINSDNNSEQLNVMFYEQRFSIVFIQFFVYPACSWRRRF
jgi:hypothetical protein